MASTSTSAPVADAARRASSRSESTFGASTSSHFAVRDKSPPISDSKPPSGGEPPIGAQATWGSRSSTTARIRSRAPAARANDPACLSASRASGVPS
jgi:hypothetical protein